MIEESDVLLSDDDHTDKSNAAVLLGQLETRGYSVSASAVRKRE